MEGIRFPRLELNKKNEEEKLNSIFLFQRNNEILKLEEFETMIHILKTIKYRNSCLSSKNLLGQLTIVILYLFTL